MEVLMKRFQALLLVTALSISSIVTTPNAEAAALKLNQTSVTLSMGKSTTLKVKGTKAKVKWHSSKKTVATVSSSGKVYAKKTGKAKITATVSGKKLSCTVTVRKKSGSGTKASPKSAYNANTFTYYEEGKKKGRFMMKLLRFASGREAAEMAKNNDSNPEPGSNQEYIYFKFQIKYLSGSQTIEAKDIFNYYYNIYGSNSTKQLTNLDWGFFFEPVDDIGTTLLSPGNDITCAKAILVEKGHSPITYRIQTGKNSYTWFTTA